MGTTSRSSRAGRGRSTRRPAGGRADEAAALGVSVRQRKYADEKGLLVRRKDGSLDVEATRSLIASETAMADGAATDYAAELRRVRLVQAKLNAEITAMERDERKGLLVRRDAVRALVDSAMVALREKLLSVPARVAGGDRDLHAAVDREIREALASAAEAVSRLGDA